MQRAFDGVSFILLALWLALAVAGGLAAAAIFPSARELPLSLAGYEEFIAARPEEGRLLVAGHLAEAVFGLAGRIALFVAPCALVALAARLLRANRRTVLLHAIPAAVAAAALAAGAFWATPAFTASDRSYRAAARAGDVETALLLKSEVDQAHERASRVATTEAFALLALVAVTGFLARPGRDGRLPHGFGRSFGRA